jgi:flagellar basal-body rod protein FlgC
MAQSAGVLDIIGSGLLAQQSRLSLIASNLANADSVTPTGAQPYRALEPVFQAIPLGTTENSPSTVAMVRTVQSSAPPQMTYDPGNPYANAQGYVSQSNVSQTQQMVDMIDATQNYSAQIAVLDQSTKLDQAMIQSMIT